MQIEKRIGREKKRCGYAPFNSAQQAIKLRSLRSLRPSGKLPSATCFIAGPLGARRNGSERRFGNSWEIRFQNMWPDAPRPTITYRAKREIFLRFGKGYLEKYDSRKIFQYGRPTRDFGGFQNKASPRGLIPGPVDNSKIRKCRPVRWQFTACWQHFTTQRVPADIPPRFYGALDDQSDLDFASDTDS